MTLLISQLCRGTWGRGTSPGERGHLCDAPERGREGSGDTPGSFLKSLSLGQRLEELQTGPQSCRIWGDSTGLPEAMAGSTPHPR